MVKVLYFVKCLTDAIKFNNMKLQLITRKGDCNPLSPLIPYINLVFSFLIVSSCCCKYANFCKLHIIDNSTKITTNINVSRTMYCAYFIFKIFIVPVTDFYFALLYCNKKNWRTSLIIYLVENHAGSISLGWIRRPSIIFP